MTLPVHNEPINKRSCFSDQPIKSKEDDLLKNNQYAKGLLEFIRISDAPITIGIQGGWGSGKTSLINLLQHELEADGENLCINVNAWQQSLFANSGRSGEIALSLLESAYGELIEQIKEKGQNGKIRINEEQKQNILRLGATVVRLTAAFSGIPLPAGSENADRAQRPAKAFKRLRHDMSEAIRSLITDPSNKLERIVIFVDDLDRIQPETAVEVLDVLKNVFDIEYCISVLAIDYDVVIKGLRKKFGEQGKNQREFRQYFDKIIQIPFSMPTSGYRDNIPALLEQLIETILPSASVENREEFIEDVTRVVLLATDGVPRSVKRIVNTASLLSIIDSVTPSETGKTLQHAEASKELELKILLAVVCLQVSFPDIHKALCKLPHITNWSEETTSNAWPISVDADNPYFDRLESEFNVYHWGPSLLKLILHHELETKAHEIRDIIWDLQDMTTEPGGLHCLHKTLRSTSITDTDTYAPSFNLAKDEAHTQCLHLLKVLTEHIGDDRLGRIHGRKVTKEHEGVWTLEHTGVKNHSIRALELEQIDIVLNLEDGSPCFTIDFLVPKAKRSPALRQQIFAAGFEDRGHSQWFGIHLPANPTNSLEPYVEGFLDDTLPRIEKLLDILG